jgi:hypothetical protein
MKEVTPTPVKNVTVDFTRAHAESFALKLQQALSTRLGTILRP